MYRATLHTRRAALRLAAGGMLLGGLAVLEACGPAASAPSTSPTAPPAAPPPTSAPAPKPTTASASVATAAPAQATTAAAAAAANPTAQAGLVPGQLPVSKSVTLPARVPIQ